MAALLFQGHPVLDPLHFGLTLHLDFAACSFLHHVRHDWETDFYTPPVLGGAALLPFSAPAVCIKIKVLRAQDSYFHHWR